jgi:hypothetical protein
MRNLADFSQQFHRALQKVLLLGMFLSPSSEIRDPIDSNLQQIERGIEEFAKEFGAVDHLKLRSRDDEVKCGPTSNIEL